MRRRYVQIGHSCKICYGIPLPLLFAHLWHWRLYADINWMQQNEEQTLEFKYTEISRRVNSQTVTNVMEDLLSLCSECMRSTNSPSLLTNRHSFVCQRTWIFLNTAFKISLISIKLLFLGLHWSSTVIHNVAFSCYILWAYALYDVYEICMYVIKLVVVLNDLVLDMISIRNQYHIYLKPYISVIVKVALLSLIQ
jgi:hypothetical protein